MWQNFQLFLISKNAHMQNLLWPITLEENLQTMGFLNIKYHTLSL